MTSDDQGTELRDALLELVAAVMTEHGEAMSQFGSWCQEHQARVDVMSTGSSQ
jgi:hypothetical protein